MQRPSTAPLPRILVLASTYPRWPDDTLPPFVHELARRLTGAFAIHVLAPHCAGAAVHERLDGVEVHRFRYLPRRFETLAYTGGMLPGLRRRPWRLLGLPVFLLAQLIASVRLLRRYRFEVIHAHWLLPQGLIAVMAKRLCGTRPHIVCTGHGADVFALNGGFSRWLKRRVLADCDAVTVASHAMLDALRHVVAVDSRYAVLPMGVDTQQRFMPAGSPRDPKALLFVGRLAEKKGVKFLLDALVLLGRHPGLKLRLIGTGPAEAGLRERVKRLGLDATVEFLGSLPNRELPHWYQTASILVFPSIVTAYGDQEGLGLVAVEALACGCAVVASDLPAIRDVVRHERTGLLVKPGDAEALAAGLTRLLGDGAMRDRLAAAGRQFVTEHFDWTHIANRYAALFHRLIDGAATAS
ncbi:MAG: glycosyltransferase [Gammaproteobacteria bacterium]|nr:glycosyltransferase [Gammaproteobacteria bacterium]